MGGAGDCITGETGTVEPEAALAELATLKPDTAAEEEEGVSEEDFSVAFEDSVYRGEKVKEKESLMKFSDSSGGGNASKLPK